MLNGTGGAYPRAEHGNAQKYPRTLTLDLPDIEDIARAIWQRQHDTLGSNSNARHWRDTTLPSKFWDEFLLDARAVLSFLTNEHVRFQKKMGGHPTSSCSDYEAGDLRTGD
jgi:hypothetical protein